jgi:hypothetical protein
MNTITLKMLLKELLSYENTTLKGCKVYIELEGQRYPIEKVEDIDAYGDNTLIIKITKTK